MLDSIKEIWNAYSEEEKKNCAFLTAIVFLVGVVIGMMIAPAKRRVIMIGNSGNSNNKIYNRNHKKEER